MKVYYDLDADTNLIKSKKILVVGYGSQGHAHALNLKDSGHNVVVGLRKNGKSWEKAKADGLEVQEPSIAVKDALISVFLIPDLSQKMLYKEIESNLNYASTILFAHGFNIHFKCKVPRNDLKVFLIAPKGPGGLVRRQYK